MGISQIITAVTVLVTGLIPASCHKTSPQTKASAGIVSGTNGLVQNLGELALTNHYERCVELGHGKNCTFTPKMLDGRNIQLTLAVETKTSNGKVKDLSVTQVVAQTGQPLEVAIGDFQFSVTPKITSE